MSPPPTKKSKSSNYGHFFKKKGLIEAGQRGFLATCNYQEKGCIRECYNVLSHYANCIYDRECDIPNLSTYENDDISDKLQREITVAQLENTKAKKSRFVALETGAKNTVFIRTTLPDPVELAWFIVRDIYNTGEKKTRTLLRLIPIEVVCSASNVQTIANAVNDIFDKHFTESCTYSIIVNRRLNNSIDRDSIIRTLAGVVHKKNANHKVDLRNPDKTVVVEIVKGICMVGVLPSYFKYKKYNLIECGRSHKTSSDEEALEVMPSVKDHSLECSDDNIDDCNDDCAHACEHGVLKSEDDEPSQVALTESPDSPEDEQGKCVDVMSTETKNNHKIKTRNVEKIDKIIVSIESSDIKKKKDDRKTEIKMVKGGMNND